MDSGEYDLRKDLIAHALKMNASGLNQGTSGNLSVRYLNGMLITPTSMPYESLQPDDICFVSVDGGFTGAHPPSSEWRFHRDIYVAKSQARAIVHAHPIHATALSIHSRVIPAVHYMIAIFGGKDVRCARYELFGTQALSDAAVEALEDRKACLLAHHGMIAFGNDLAQAYWLATELETLSRQYICALALGDPPTLSATQIEEVKARIGGYGPTGDSR